MASDYLTCTICSSAPSVSESSASADVPGSTRRFSSRIFSVWRCPECLSIHSRVVVDQDSAYADYPLKKQKDDFFLRTTLSVRLRRLIASGLRLDHTILDYGCGLGHFVNHLKRYGYLNAEGYDAYVPGYSDPRVFDHLYDYVTCQDVIEHVPDPQDLMRKLAQLVKPGGVLCIGTPDAEHIDLERETTRELQFNLHLPFHLHTLSHRALVRLSSECGLELVKTYKRYYFDTLFPGYNFRFVQEYIMASGGNLDSGFEPFQIKVLLQNPKLWIFMFFGYFFPKTPNRMWLFRKTSPQPI